MEAGASGPRRRPCIGPATRGAGIYRRGEGRGEGQTVKTWELFMATARVSTSRAVKSNVKRFVSTLCWKCRSTASGQAFVQHIIVNRIKPSNPPPPPPPVVLCGLLLARRICVSQHRVGQAGTKSFKDLPACTAQAGIRFNRRCITRHQLGHQEARTVAW